MNREHRNARALRLLILILFLGWLGRAFWWDHYVELSESPPRERISRPRPARQPSVALQLPDLPEPRFDPQKVRIELETVPSPEPGIRISEIHYHPHSDTGEAEFIELTNTSEETVSLAGWEFHRGISYRFGNGVELRPGECFVLCRNREAFRSVFGDGEHRLAVYEGGLRNSGERLSLSDPDGKLRADVSFADVAPWSVEADGAGDSLHLAGVGYDAKDPAAWYASKPSPGQFENRASGVGTPSVYEVNHSPKSPEPGEVLTIAARVRGVASPGTFQLKLQVAGAEYSYDLVGPEIRGEAETSMVRVHLDGLDGDTLVRYWFEAKGETAEKHRWPRFESGTPNFAAFVSEKKSEASPVPVYHLLMNPSDMKRLHRLSNRNDTVPTTLVYRGEVFDHLAIRIRGAYARRWPKKAYKIFFKRHQLFRGRSRINLNSGWRDPAMVREVLAYRIYGIAGGLSLDSRLVRVNLNGDFWGLFVEVEHPDKRYLEDQGLKGAALYKADSPRNQSDERMFHVINEYARHYRKETKEEAPFDDLDQFCRMLNQGESREQLWSDPIVRTRFLNYLCATTIVQNWDGFNKNHYIGFENGDSKRWFFLPWDLDRTLGDSWHWHFDETRMPLWLGTERQPGVTGWNRVIDAVLKDPTMRREYLDRLEVLLRDSITPEWIESEVDVFSKQLATGASMDRERWGGEQDWMGELRRMGERLVERRQFLLERVAAERSAAGRRGV